MAALAPAAAGVPALSTVQAWGYQLQNVRPDRIPPSVDLLVVDYARDGTERTVFSRDEVAALKRRAADKPRIVLAYMSVGEAERFRYYWSPIWRFGKPDWVGPENKDWPDHFVVRHWDPGWQRLIIDPKPSALQRLSEFHLRWLKPYVDRIIEAGFDGVYLDRVDGYDEWQKERPTARQEMIDLVRHISAYAKARRPGFLVVPQNAEELLQDKDYLAAIDAVAKESLLYGLVADGKRNPETDIMAAVADLTQAQAARLPVLVVEYLDAAERRFEADLALRQWGFLPLFATRMLDRAPEVIARPPGLVSGPRPVLPTVK